MTRGAPVLPPPPILCAVSSGVPDRLPVWVRAAASAGVSIIQIRERAVDDRVLTALVRQAVAAVHGSGARVVVNERIDVAIAAGAHGVHLPARAPATARVRAVVPEDFLLGRSVHELSEALSEEQSGACDYLIFGTIFPTASKPADFPVAGVEALRRVCASVGLPVLAIGGVTTGRAEAIARTGAAGVAAISLFADAGPSVGGATLNERVEAVRRAFGVAPPQGASWAQSSPR